MDEEMPFLRPFVLPYDPVPPVSEGGLDLYLPAADGSVPAVLLVHGGPIRPGVRGPRDWPAYRAYGSLLAGAGLVGAMFQHRFQEGSTLDDVSSDISAALAQVRAHPRVDPRRLAVWAFSAGGVVLGRCLAGSEPGVAAVAASYALLDLPPDEPMGDPSPVSALGPASPPVLLTLVEHEWDWVAATQERFLAVARERGASVDTIEVAGAEHGFETLDASDAARRAITGAVAWLGRALRPAQADSRR